MWVGARKCRGGPICYDVSDMKYMLLICGDESGRLSPEEEEEMEAGTIAWVDEMGGRGIRLLGNRLRPTADARTVRIRDGERLVSDGPYAESKEQFGGFDIIECAGIDEAVEVASKHPVARFGTIEVRPFWDD
jgi:hypothetical protein